MILNSLEIVQPVHLYTSGGEGVQAETVTAGIQAIVGCLYEVATLDQDQIAASAAVADSDPLALNDFEIINGPT